VYVYVCVCVCNVCGGSQVPLGIISGPIKEHPRVLSRDVPSLCRGNVSGIQSDAHVRDGGGSVWVVNEFLNEPRRFMPAWNRKIMETLQMKI